MCEKSTRLKLMYSEKILLSRKVRKKSIRKWQWGKNEWDDVSLTAHEYKTWQSVKVKIVRDIREKSHNKNLVELRQFLFLYEFFKKSAFVHAGDVSVSGPALPWSIKRRSRRSRLWWNWALVVAGGVPTWRTEAVNQELTSPKSY